MYTQQQQRKTHQCHRMVLYIVPPYDIPSISFSIYRKCQFLKVWLVTAGRLPSSTPHNRGEIYEGSVELLFHSCNDRYTPATLEKKKKITDHLFCQRSRSAYLLLSSPVAGWCGVVTTKRTADYTYIHIIVYIYIWTIDRSTPTIKWWLSP